MIDIPRLIKGFEKSITSSLTRVIVNGAIAISAFCKGKQRKLIVPGVMAGKESWLHYWIKREGEEIKKMAIITSLVKSH